MQEEAIPRADPSEPIAQPKLTELQRRSDARGLLRLSAHLVAIFSTGALYAYALARAAHWALWLGAAVAFGFTLVTMFAAMHETVHRTAFKTRWLNDGVAWFAGLLSFYNSTFYRPYHGQHHRFTQIPGQDPELEDPKPTSFVSYVVEMSGVTWWLGKLKTHATLALGRTAHYPFLNEQNARLVVRSVRCQLGVYGAAIAASFALGAPYFVTYFLVPVALGQPLLRAILLAEHTGCSESDDPLTNTRTTHTLPFVRLLMWEMPFHAEHHRYPALPFFALSDAHGLLGPHLAHVERHGYVGVHAALLKSFGRVTSEPAS